MFQMCRQLLKMNPYAHRFNCLEHNTSISMINTWTRKSARLWLHWNWNFTFYFCPSFWFSDYANVIRVRRAKLLASEKCQNNDASQRYKEAWRQLSVLFHNRLTCYWSMVKSIKCSCTNSVCVCVCECRTDIKTLTSAFVALFVKPPVSGQRKSVSVRATLRLYL